MIPLTWYEESAAWLKEQWGVVTPEFLLVLGSGLGPLSDAVLQKKSVAYAEIPHFPLSTAPGHDGKLIYGSLAGRRVLVMQGRFHAYEGWSPEEIVYPVRIAKLLGATGMVVTNVCGGVNPHYRPGDFMLIADHLMLFPMSPLIGENVPAFGERFPDMSDTYTPEWRSAAIKAALRSGVALREGVYCFFPGPQYETPAEVRACRALGADAVGMSTVPEVIAARHCGMKILGISLISNMAAGLLNQPLNELEVLNRAEDSSSRFSKLMIECLKDLR